MAHRLVDNGIHLEVFKLQADKVPFYLHSDDEFSRMIAKKNWTSRALKRFNGPTASEPIPDRDGGARGSLAAT